MTASFEIPPPNIVHKYLLGSGEISGMALEATNIPDFRKFPEKSHPWKTKNIYSPKNLFTLFEVLVPTDESTNDAEADADPDVRMTTDCT